MSRTPKTDRREEARSRAIRLKAAQEQAARRQRTLTIVLTTVGILVVGSVVAFILMNQPEPAPDLSSVEDPLGSVSAPATANEAGGIPVGADGVAGGTAASPETVVVAVYSDYMCPICGLFEAVNGPVLKELREAGDVVVEYRPVSILDRTSQGTQYSTRAAAAAALVADRAPDAFVTFNDLLFANQPAEGTAGLSDVRLAELATEAGAPEAVASSIVDGSHMSGEDSFANWVAAATEQATRDFAPQFGTPTILIDGEKLEVDWRIEGALATAVEEARG
jgi:protein-disulfide isomerase